MLINGSFSESQCGPVLGHLGRSNSSNVGQKTQVLLPVVLGQMQLMQVMQSRHDAVARRRITGGEVMVAWRGCGTRSTVRPLRGSIRCK